jgi:hypothetical protein
MQRAGFSIVLALALVQASTAAAQTAGDTPARAPSPPSTTPPPAEAPSDTPPSATPPAAEPPPENPDGSPATPPATTEPSATAAAAPAPDAPKRPKLNDAQEAKLRVMVAEIRYKRQSLRFDASYEPLGGVSTETSAATPPPQDANAATPPPQDAGAATRPAQDAAGPRRQWTVFQGKADQQIDALTFYRALGRDDLVSAYHQRRYLMYGGFIAGGVGFAAAALFNVTDIANYGPCERQMGSAAELCQMNQRGSLIPTIIALSVAVTGTAIGTYFYRNPQPLDEDTARSLAAAYNQRLRHVLGLPEPTRHAGLQDVKLIPFVADRDAGVALGGRF